MRLIFLFIVLASFFAQAVKIPLDKTHKISLSSSEKEKVNEGAIVVRRLPNPGKAGRTYEAIGIIKGTMEEVKEVLTDNTRFTEFMPNLEKMTVVKREGIYTYADYQIGLPLGKKKKYRLKGWDILNPGDIKLFWKKVEGPKLKESETIKDTSGYWHLRSYPEKPGHIIALYHIYTDPGHIPWGFGWIVNWLIDRSMPDVINVTRSRVKALYYSN